ncbi:bifunctional 2-polyprenyl-6-hydroxyphenol methylase/3-demethylubiquinol 3-O-methyltransferase UbiG [Comamonas flocculans]|uniref:Ubiquinone biosynthesis O-methyltransferase n=1 Tax=Comamonas flocculans TaxID=2597701 RepID=A0A5B8RSK5_9BURK|nr:bifunctional 2-polyprenyl-6-hydroxyphenol methylase/3-demethylubiquinol 3-O-methyltransferase UbiG [Comamonas flocculans]QEA11692.1 bifunctional 2-polyprenyl-6-hydroxyphenol methylase/3-demethylubiquinol 3-O-methyltransferase UbiG [Comamonas flocculans]
MTTNPPSNVDRREVDKFDRIARLWWDPKGKMGMLHVINPLRSQFTFDHVDVRGKRVVDVGCGGGILTETLAKAGADVIGLDQSELTLQVARRHAAQAGLSIDYRLQTVETLAQQEPGSYDVVTCLEMLEHVPDPAAIIQACAQLLKPGGHAIFSTINRNFKAWLFAIIGGEYILRILPRGTHDYAKLIRPDELRSWAGQAGLKHLRSASLMYHPLFKRFRVAAGKEDVNYMMSCVKEA